MGKYLLSATKTYRVDTEKEAQALIQKNKEDGYGDLVKYSSVYKTLKQKNEIVDDWYRVTLTKVFSDEKEPSGTMQEDDEDYEY